MKLVEDFMQVERAKLNWLERLIRNYPVFFFAKDLEIKQKEFDLKPRVIIKPSLFRRIIAFGFIVAGLIAWLTFLNVVLQNILFPISLIFLFLITFWIGFVIWNFFLNPKYSYKIYLDKNSFRTKTLDLKWDTISEVLVMAKGGGRHMISTLVLFEKDNSIHRFSLENMGISNIRILKLIEIFRQKSKLS